MFEREEPPRTLVFGAAGVQGGAVLDALVARGHRVIPIVRNEERRAAFAGRGLDARVASLEDLPRLREAAAGAELVALTLPQIYDRERALQGARRVVAALEAARPRLVVYNSGSRLPPDPTDVDGFELRRALEEIVRGADLPVVCLRPTFYMENLAGPWTAGALWKDGLLAYPLAAELRASWIAAADLGALVAEALGRPALAGRMIEVGGPEALDGPALAATFARAWGRPVRYAPIPLASFEAALAGPLGAGAAASITAMYRWMEAHRRESRFHTEPAAPAEALPGPATSLSTWIARQDWTRLAAVA